MNSATIQAFLNFPLVDLGSGPITPASLLLGVVVMIITVILSKLMRKSLLRLNQGRYALTKSSSYTLQRLVHYLTLIVGIFVALSVVGIDFGKLALVMSALSVGIGFGLQAIVSNFVSGLIILLEKSLKVGDFVQLESGVAGVVTEIRVRATVITTAENTEILVPNSEFVNGKVTNWTHSNEDCRHRIPFGVAYGTDKDRMREVVIAAAKAMPLTVSERADMEPDVYMKDFGDSSLNFELLVWTKPEYATKPSLIRSRYLWAIETALREADITVPFPQRDLHLVSGFPAPSEQP